MADLENRKGLSITGAFWTGVATCAIAGGGAFSLGYVTREVQRAFEPASSPFSDLALPPPTMREKELLETLELARKTIEASEILNDRTLERLHSHTLGMRLPPTEIELADLAKQFRELKGEFNFSLLKFPIGSEE
jgi:hypothetical protein